MIKGTKNVFAVVENHFNGMQLKYGWCCVISDVFAFLNYSEHVQEPRMQAAFISTAKIMEQKIGHHNNMLASTAEVVSKVRGISIAHAYAELSDKFTQGCLGMIEKYGSIYIQRSGGYFAHTDAVKIIKTFETEKFDWPSDKLTMADIVIDKWPQGRHWYISTKYGERITDGDMEKFNTYGYAKEVAERYLESHNARINSVSKT